MRAGDVTREAIDAYELGLAGMYTVRFATVYPWRKWIKARREAAKVLREGFADVRWMLGGYSPFTRHRPVELVGRRQRVRAAARALLRRFPIVLAAPATLADIRGEHL